jgi:elongation factor 1-gamma
MSAEYRKINPVGKVPCAETPEGVLFETGAIIRYIARKTNMLYGSSHFENSLVDQWYDHVRNELGSRIKVLAALLGILQYQMTQEEFEKGIDDLLEALKVLNDHLKDKQYLVGNQLTLADIVLMIDIHYGFRFVFTEKQRSQIANISEYFYRLAALPEFKGILGIVPKITERMNIKFVNKKEQHKKEEKPKAAPKKEEKPKPVPKKEEDEPMEEKPVEYKFPETSFNLHDFKTLYVNEPDKQKALDFLWKNWDNNAFSFWRLRYDKLPLEGKVVFPTNGLMNGFMDRADATRKHALGVIGVYGDEPDLEIRGVWMWRGTEVNPYMKDHPQFEYWECKKLDVNNEQDRALITEYWTKLGVDTDKVEGLTTRTAMIFK